MIGVMELDCLNIRQLEAFCAVVSAGSLTAAARQLGRSQPAMTRLIQDLEETVGFVLFHRNGPRIVLSEQGGIFHAEVDRFLSGCSLLIKRVNDIRNEIAAPFELSAIPAMANGVLPAALACLPADLLPAHVHLQSVPAAQVTLSVVARRAGLGITSFPVDHPEVDVLWIGEACCMVALQENDPLVNQEAISLRQFKDRDIVTIADRSRLRGRIDAAFMAENVRPRRIFESTASVTALSMANAGLGVAIVDPATASGMSIKGITVRPLAERIPFFFGVIKPGGHILSPGLAALSETLKTVATQRLSGFRLHGRASSEIIEEALCGYDPALRS
ncbi:LysR family transcriptional regulator [Gluconobacter kondonii]|uniref:LysR family transcriptional regulator n=1 Tax=Gluconobacter kondonii TaxID=941463 RepID=UPI001B8AE50C|nr:LysR family transcriptional regulator [Gluconobacter kondonii]